MHKEAAVLQEVLSAFCKLDFPARQKALPNLKKTIDQLATRDVVMSLVDLRQAKLIEGVERALATPLRCAEGSLESNVWNGPHTVVVLRTNGQVAAATCDESGLVNRKYGDLFKYAFMKAVLCLHLRFSKQEGGLNGGNNFAHVQKLLPGETIFLGEAYGFVDEPVAIGVSGAELSGDYRKKLAPMLAKLSDEDAMEFVAGAADQAFAEIVDKMINASGLDSVAEPKFFAELRRSH